jgi:16S rRNA (guanine966-N2)-methyltransferase
MKIISGFLKNRKIPTASADFRPSTGRFKEALFSILSSGNFSDFSFEDKNILELFCGSCSIGFEAISRGAKSATFIDTNQSHLKIAQDFAVKMNIGDRTNFINMDATKLKTSRVKYNFVFLDPPYRNAMAKKTLQALDTNSWLESGSLVIIELGKNESLEVSKPYERQMERVYSNSKMIILTYSGAD